MYTYLVSLLEQVDQVTTDGEVTPVEEGSRGTGVTGTTSTTNSVGVLGNVRGQVVKDDVSDIGNVETTGGNSSGNKDGATAGTEAIESGLTLTLGTVTVDSGGAVALRAKEITKLVGHTLGLDEDKDETSRRLGEEKVKEQGSLVVVVDILDTLGDVLGSRSNTSDGKENVLLQEHSGQTLDLLGEGGGEHKGLSALNSGHILSLNDPPDLRLETHVQHPIGLVEDKELDVGERNLAALDQVDETTRSGGKQVTAAVESADLGSDIGSTVHDGGTDPGSVGKLPSLLVDLRDQLTGRSKNKGGRISLARPAKAIGSVVRRRSRRTLSESGRKDGEEESTSLSGTGLSTSHQITTTGDDGDRVLLDGRRGSVTRVRNVLEQNRVDGLGESENWLGDIGTSSLDRDIGVTVKVNTRGLDGVSTLMQTQDGYSPGEHRLQSLRKAPSPSWCSWHRLRADRSTSYRNREHHLHCQSFWQQERP
jgi:hypothetical protein